MIFLLIDQINKGGAEKILKSYASFLQGRGYKIVILSLFSKNEIEGMVCKHGIAHLPDSLFVRILFMPFIYLKFSFYCFKYRPIALYSFLDLSNILTFSLPVKCKKIYSIHNKLSIQYKKYNKYIYTFVRSLLKTIYNRTKDNSIIAVSSFVKKDLVENFSVEPNKFVIINNRINVSALNSRKDAPCDYFLEKSIFKLGSIGRFSLQKAQWKIIKACKLLKDDHIAFKFYLIGDGEFKPLLIDLIGKYNLEKHVEIVPYMDNPFPVFGQLDLLVLSSLYEGSPIVVTEAVNLNVPFIGSRDALSEDIFKNNYNDYLYDNLIYSYSDEIQNDDVELYKLIKKCIIDPDFRLRILNDCSDWTREDESIMYKEYESLMKK